MTVCSGMLASIVSSFCRCHRHDTGMLASLFYSFIKGQSRRQLFFAMDILLFRALTPRVSDCVLLQLISKSCQSCIKMTHQLCNYRARWCLTFSSLFVLCAAILFDCFVAARSRDVATAPVAPIDLKVNLAAGSEFWQGQPTVERGARLRALNVFRQCLLVK